MANQPHWTAFAGPALQFLTALIAAGIAYRFGSIQAAIARQQAMTAALAAQTARNRLKFDLFERREAMYDLVYGYLDKVVSAGKIESAADSEFLTAVRAVGWLTDKTVTQFIFKDLRDRMIEMSTVAAQLESNPSAGTARVDLMMKHSTLKSQLYKQHEQLANVFEPFLKLEH